MLRQCCSSKPTSCLLLTQQCFWHICSASHLLCKLTVRQALCSASCLFCKLSVLRDVCSASCLLCSLTIQRAIYPARCLSCKTYVLQDVCPASRLFCRPSVLQTVCSASYLSDTSSCLPGEDSCTVNFELHIKRVWLLCLEFTGASLSCCQERQQVHRIPRQA